MNNTKIQALIENHTGCKVLKLQVCPDVNGFAIRAHLTELGACDFLVSEGEVEDVQWACWPPKQAKHPSLTGRF